MKISINRNTGQVVASSELCVHSARLSILGRVDCLHTSKQATWNPSLDTLEKYLASLPIDNFKAGVPSIEGNFLILWKNNSKFYICCDRYRLNPIYYRLTPTSLDLFDRIFDRPDKLSISKENATTFLLLRFIPGRHSLFNGIDLLMPGDCIELDTLSGEASLDSVCVYPYKNILEVNAESASQTFHKLFLEGLQNHISLFGSEEKLLLPLSGGLDSRYVLGTALELVAPSRIIAMTFGTPGSYDFDIGSQVAKTAGVKHVPYPLTTSHYTTDAFCNNCLDTDGQISFTTEAPVEIYEDFAQYGSVVISGYVGDAVMGKKSHQNTNSSHRSIILDDMIVNKNDPLTNYLTSFVVDDSFFFENDQLTSLTVQELWFFINHFTKYSFYCVCKLRDHLKYINPFIDYTFLDYFLNLPSEYRNNRNLYFAWLQKHFPKLANLPCSTFRGAHLSAPTIEKWLFHQWDRLIHYGFGINRGINKIDLYRFYHQLLDPDILLGRFSNILPSEFTQRMVDKQKYYLLLYNLKCLDILRSEFSVDII